MKTKLIKNTGFYRLVVDDKDINKQYDCTQKEPICLAKLEGWQGTQLWSLCDLRLSQHSSPNPYLEGFTDEMYEATSEEDKNNLISKLQHYRVDGNKVYWPSFEGIVAFGDKTNTPNLPSYLSRRLTGFWSFQAGMDKLNEIRTFWETQATPDLMIKIENPHKQISRSEYWFEKILKEQKLETSDTSVATNIKIKKLI